MRDEAALQPVLSLSELWWLRGAQFSRAQTRAIWTRFKDTLSDKGQARILGKTFWDLYKYLSAGGEPLVLALALLQAVEEFRSKSLLSDTGHPQ